MADGRQARIAVVGPVPPFRGGIAQHTMMLSRALMPSADVLVLSFTRQYPGWLYPGATDRDPAAQPMREPECRFILDSLDPRSWRKAADEIGAFRADAVIMPWWSAYWSASTAYLIRRLARLGIPAHVVCHNVASHGAAAWSRPLVKLALGGASGFVVQSEQEGTLLRGWMPRARIAVAPHPVFSQFPEPSTALPRRADLELLFFGFVRPYKGLDVLFHALARLSHRDWKLTVAGEFWQSAERFRKLSRTLGLDDRIEFIDRYIDEDEASRLFARADALIMPYLRATGSGVLGLAYRYGRPIVASNVAGLAEFVQNGQTGFLADAGSAGALASAIDRVSAATARRMQPAIARVAAGMTWEALATTVMQQVQSDGR